MAGGVSAKRTGGLPTILASRAEALLARRSRTTPQGPLPKFTSYGLKVSDILAGLIDRLHNLIDRPFPQHRLKVGLSGL
jgi:hypothetical protein